MNWVGIFNAASTVLGIIAMVGTSFVIGFLMVKFDDRHGQGSAAGCAILCLLAGLAAFGIIGTPLSYYMMHRNDAPQPVEVEAR
jgi:hypothetical protein